MNYYGFRKRSKSKMKKLIALIFISLIIISAFAQDNSRILTNAKVDELCAVTGMARDSIEEFTIPEEYTIIGESAFEECHNLKTITLNSNITVIEDYAFARTAIKDLTIPDSIESIGKGVLLNVIIYVLLQYFQQFRPKFLQLLKGNLIIYIQVELTKLAFTFPMNLLKPIKRHGAKMNIAIFVYTYFQ